MRKEDCILLNQILEQMQMLAERLDESMKKQDFELVLKIKKQLSVLQERINTIL